MILFYCLGLHQSGGLSVLDTLISQSSIKGNFHYYFDKRAKNKIKNIINKNVYFKNSNLLIRIFDEFLLSRNKSFDKICFLNGLPSFFKHKKAISIVLFQNINIFKSKDRNFFNWFFSMDLIRFLKFYFFKHKVDEWAVLSMNAKRQLEKFLYKSSKIVLIDIEHYNEIQIYKSDKEFDFFFPATLGYHKNHKKLIEAFILLAKDNIFPRLLLTLTKKELNSTNFEKLANIYNLNIVYKSFDSNEISLIYSKCKALVYPSFVETLGIPLIEAKRYELDVLASELDYVRDVVDPNETFDPQSSLSMYRAIKRYLKIKNKNKNNFIDYEIYLKYLEKK